jgi:hypothetical protein
MQLLTSLGLSYCRRTAGNAPSTTRLLQGQQASTAQASLARRARTFHSTDASFRTPPFYASRSHPRIKGSTEAVAP